MASPRSWQPAPAALSYRVRFSIRLFNLLLVIGLVLLLPLALPITAHAQAPTVLYVDKDASGPTYDGLSWATAYHTVQEALDVTNANGAADYEVWVAEGTYYPDEGGSHVDNSRAESFFVRYDNVQLYGGFAGTETGRDQRDWAAHPAVLSGDIDGDGTLTGNAYHVVYMDGVTNEGITAATVLDGFTVTGGNADGGTPDDSGGGLYCAGSGSGHLCSPTLRNLLVSGNSTSGNGGGVLNNGIGGESSPTLTNVTISGNRAAHGGGIYNAGYSGGVSSPTLTNVLVSGNKVIYNGGGIYNNGADTGVNDPVLTNVTVSGNNAGSGGGGMFNHGQNGESSPALLNSIVWGNAASSGAQIYNNWASISATYSDVQGGQAGQAGTGNLNADPLFAAPVAADSAPTTTGSYRLTSVSPAIDAGTNGGCPTADLDGRLRPIDGNGDGSAVCDMGAYETPQTPYLRLSKQVTPQSAAPGATVTYTLVMSNEGAIEDVGVRLTDTLPAEVSFSGWVQNPGATETGGEITWQGSLARAAVLTFTFSAEYHGSSDVVVNTAQAGDAERTVSAAATFSPPAVVLYVDKDAPSPAHNGLSWGTAYRTVQEALDVAAANRATDYEIWVAEGTYYPDEGGSHVDNSRDESFRIRYDNVQLYGGFAGTETGRDERDWTAHPTILSGDIDGDGTLTNNAWHVLWVDGVTNEQITAATVVDGFTITGGNANGSGGGIYCAGDGSGHLCSPTLANLIIRDNAATSYGGGMYNDAWPNGESSPTLTNVTFGGNRADYGGGLYNDGYGNGQSSPTLTNVTVSDNVANDDGGGIYNDGGDRGTSNPTLTNVTISGNHAGNNGGGMYNAGYDSGASNPLLTNVTISGNSAGGKGGAMYNDGDSGVSSPLLTNVLISGNRAGSGGGMYNNGFRGLSSPLLTNVTISGNRADYACGGMCNDGDSGVSSPVLLNSIVWGNTASSAPEIFNDTATPDISYSNVGGGYTGTATIDANPLFAAPIDASSAPTATGDYRLLPGSPAIDTGTNTGAPTADLRGLPRPVNLVTDMGAYEAQGFSLAITSGDAQTATVGATFAQSLTVQVGSAAGEPVGPSGVLTLTPPSSGPGLDVTAPFTLTTDANGNAAATAAANGLAGSYGVVVTAGGAATPAAFNLTNTPLYLMIATAGSGSGAVTSTPAGIDCGAACTAGFDFSTVITVTATANTGYTFVNWTEGGAEVSRSAAYSFTATGNRSLVAHFRLNFPIYYVDKDAAGPVHDGGSWATAYTTVQDALDAVVGDDTHYEVWVAEGTYYPDEGSSHIADSRGESFRIRYDNVQLYGGFAGTETGRDERDWTAHPTILSGDIDGDGTLTNNAWHVLWVDGVTNEQITAATVVDGFTITGGNADGSDPDDSGGGLYCAGDGSGHLCSPTLANLIIRDNAATGYGGGMYNDGYPYGESSPTLTNVTISGNHASQGGGLYNDGYGGGQSSPTLTDVTVSDNVASENGGGIYNDGGNGGESSPTLTNVTISGNHAGNNGGGMYNAGYDSGASNPLLTNVTISGNSAGGKGGAMYNFGNGGASSPLLTGVRISGNSAMAGGGMYNNGDSSGKSSPLLINVLISGNHAIFGGGMYNSGNSSGESSPQMMNVTVSGNDADHGGGMINYGLDDGESSPVLLNSIMWGNAAEEGAQIFNRIATPDISYSNVGGGYTGTGNIDADPLFAAPIDASSAPTATGDYRLRFDSPAIDTGTNTGAPTADLRGLPRPVNLVTDMGAYEAQGFSLAITGGDAQTAAVGTAFAQPLTVQVSSAATEPVGPGVVITVTPPAGGPGLSVTAPFTLTTDAGGIVTATVTANTLAGGYGVTVTAGGAIAPAAFNLTNAPLYLTVANTGSGSGAVSSTPAGIDCGAACTAAFDYDTSVTLVANASAGSTFGGWSGACSGTGTCTVTMTETKAVTATFTLNQYTVAVSADPAAGGGVSGGGAVSHGDAVTVTAAANVGYTFVNWTEGGQQVSADASYSFTATGNRSLVATFTLNQYTVAVSADPAAGGSVSGGGAVSHGDAVTVTAAANTGYTFVNWTEGGQQVSTDATYSFTATGNRSLVATFTLNQYTVAVSADPAAGGTVSGGGAVSHGDTVTVTAAANIGYTFVNWTEGGQQVSTDAGYSFTAAGSRTLVAHFQQLLQPLAHNDAAGVLEGAAVDVFVIANDEDPAGQGLAVIGVTQPTHGAASINADAASVRYTPAGSYSGDDSFTYTVQDANGLRSTGTVAIVIAPQDAAEEPPQLAVLDPSVYNSAVFTGSLATVQADLPAGFFTGTLGATDIFFLAYTPVVTPTMHTLTPPGTLRFGSFEFHLTAYVNERPQNGVRLAQPITLTIRYNPAILLGLDPAALQLYTWGGDAWSTEGITLVSHDIPNGTLTVAVSHLSEFAFFAAAAPSALDPAPEPDDSTSHLYLPTLSK